MKNGIENVSLKTISHHCGSEIESLDRKLMANQHQVRCIDLLQDPP